MGADDVDTLLRLVLRTDPGVDLDHSLEDHHNHHLAARTLVPVLDRNLRRTGGAVDRILILGSGRTHRPHHIAAGEETVAGTLDHRRRTSNLVGEVVYCTAGTAEEGGCIDLEGLDNRRHLGQTRHRRYLAKRWVHQYQSLAAMAEIFS